MYALFVVFISGHGSAKITEVDQALTESQSNTDYPFVYYSQSIFFLLCQAMCMVFVVVHVHSGVTMNSGSLHKYPSPALPPLSLPSLPSTPSLLPFLPFPSLPSLPLHVLPSFSSPPTIFPTLSFPFPPSCTPYNGSGVRGAL